VVRGRVTICVALAVGLFCARAQAQTSTPPQPVQGEPPPRNALPTDGLGTQVPSVAPRTAYQPVNQLPATPTSPDVSLPPGTIAPTPKARPRKIQYTSRYGTPITVDTQPLADGVRRTVIIGGVILNVTGETTQDDFEIAADEVVFWERGLEIDKKFQPPGTPPLEEGHNHPEFYLSGNVVLRTKPKTGPVSVQILRAKEIYYDVDEEKAIALSADMEYTPILPTPGGPIPAPDPFHFFADELRKLDAENYEGFSASFNCSKLPSDPGIRLDAPRMTMTDRIVQLRNVFGLPYRDLLTGEPVIGSEKIVTAYDAVPKFLGVPVGYFPWYRADANEPLGPFVSIGGGADHIFGVQIDTTWNLFELLALKPPPGMKWTLELDYLSDRGPAIGTDYKYNIPPSDPSSGLSATQGLIKYYTISDHGTDILGGDRGPEPNQPTFRDRFLWQHQQEFSPDLYFQGQLAYLSDKNFLEQYYKLESDTAPNQETFANLTWQRNNWWLSGLIEPHFDRPWVPETAWLPKVDGALIGQSLLDRIVYSGRASAGFAMNYPTQTNPVSLLPTDQQVNTGRLDLMQEASVPFSLGPFQFAPYAMLDLTGYSQDLDGDAVGRVWGGGGTRASVTMSHLYEGVTSDLFNIRDLYHKMVMSANYLYAQTNVHYNQLPILDRLNDDATDQSWRNITPMQSLLVPGPVGVALQNSPLYDPQLYAIRRAMLDKVDTLDNIDVLQLDLRQRLQTQRGYPGEEHEVDLVSLDTSLSYFPQANRDNFGHPWAFAEWDFLWNVGDRVAITSTGWIEPYSGGSRYWTLGAYLNRPDKTNFYIGYRQIDPLNSRVVTAAIGYQLSKRYFLSGSTSYDFGLNQSAGNSLNITRVGTDLTVSIGITYNSLVNNFGVTFMVMPNLFSALTPAGMPGMGQGIGANR
jgi:hypothetical protein